MSEMLCSSPCTWKIMSERKQEKLTARLGRTLRRLGRFLFNPRFMLCFGIGWMITNGWSYVGFWLGSWLKIGWLKYISSAYLALLWLPFTPEKLLTLAIALALLKLLFPGDRETLAVLHELRLKAVEEFNEFKRRRRLKKRAKNGSAAAPPEKAEGSEKRLAGRDKEPEGPEAPKTAE